MKKKGIIISFLLVLMWVTVFSQDNIKVKGSIDSKEYAKIFIVNIQSNAQVATSDIDEKGQFFMSFSSATTDFYRLSVNDKEKKYVFLVLEPDDDVQVQLKASDFNQSVITGSKHSELIFETFHKMEEYDAKAEAYKKKMSEERMAFLKLTLLENKNSLATLIFLDNFTIESEPDLFKAVSSSLNEEYSSNRFVSDLDKRVKSALQMGLGAEAPEISLYSPDSVLISLSSLRGKVVLIDFWASWCGPCRRESPALVQLYNMYKDKGFEIYGVSLDNNHAKWVQAIKADNLSWTHVSDLKHWKSSVVPLYGFKGIPFTVLIDKNGRIIAKGLRGEQLKVKLDELLK